MSAVWNAAVLPQKLKCWLFGGFRVNRFERKSCFVVFTVVIISHSKTCRPFGLKNIANKSLFAD